MKTFKSLKDLKFNKLSEEKETAIKGGLPKFPVCALAEGSYICTSTETSADCCGDTMY